MQMSGNINSHARAIMNKDAARTLAASMVMQKRYTKNFMPMSPVHTTHTTMASPWDRRTHPRTCCYDPQSTTQMAYRSMAYSSNNPHKPLATIDAVDPVEPMQVVNYEPRLLWAYDTGVKHGYLLASTAKRHPTFA